MLRAYGLVYNLLRAGVPVHWVIKPGKAFSGIDFTASATDHQNAATVITNHGYRGGPFVIAASDASAALPLIDAWQTAYPATKVHQATADFDGDTQRLLLSSPKLAILNDGNQAITFTYLNNAGIPDANGNVWGPSSPGLLSLPQVAGPTTTNHRDGALFDANGNPNYCQFLTHLGVAQAQNTPEVIAETREFLLSPVHLMAACDSAASFENDATYGHLLTTLGLVSKALPATVTYSGVDRTFMQLDGAFSATGGSFPSYALGPGSSYKLGGVAMMTATGSTEGQWDVWMTGYPDGYCLPTAPTCLNLGKVSYLGGHQYTTTLPISTHPTTQGVRLFLNSLFDSPCSLVADRIFADGFQ
jgi:hypothetical protein